ncbi:MAG: 50S ribosomal protein L29 [Alphaproteobacteria bacterium]|nr:50S ribosomal protein L29 [Alphaproteobacteria bacterium]
MKIAEIRGKSAEELKGVLLSLKKEQFNLRFQAATGELANRSRFKDVRRAIARIMTVMGNGDTAPKAQAAAPSKKKKG